MRQSILLSMKDPIRLKNTVRSQVVRIGRLEVQPLLEAAFAVEAFRLRSHPVVQRISELRLPKDSFWRRLDDFRGTGRSAM